MNDPVKRVVVVGGGAAGWLSAGLIAARHDSANESGLEVVLIESPDVVPIGVGEGTWPTMRKTLATLGISEVEFVTQCDASFKQGTRFDRWVTGNEDRYYHPFTLPLGYVSTNLAESWLPLRDEIAFADAVTPQTSVCASRLAPKQAGTPEYAGVVNYGYHLDAGKFATLLQRHCTHTLGVRHILDHVTQVNTDDSDYIESLDTTANGKIGGDLFIDCTGFASLLIGGHYEVPFIDKRHQLFIDTALAVQIPYPDDASPIESQTVSTAQRAGWIWDIGLSSRRGVGYVYSSAHLSDEAAEQELRAHIGDSGDALTMRKIPIRPGHREKFWHKNCVAVGMSAGFLEPLEASALVMIELSAQMISEQLPATRDSIPVVADRFNKRFRYRWARVIEFLKLHYVLTRRQDSDFWIDNCNPESIPDELQQSLTLWRYRAPWHGDLDHADEVFSSASYQYVLYGMGFETAAAATTRTPEDTRVCRQLFDQVQQKTRQLLAGLPTNRDLIDRIKLHGLPPSKVA